MTAWTERDAFAALATLEGVGRRSLAAIRTGFRSWTEAVQAPAEALADWAASGHVLAGEAIRSAGDLRGHLDDLEARAAAAGARLVTELDPDWPRRLVEIQAADPISEPPSVLFVKGDLSPLSTRFAVGVVGSRKPDPLAREQTARLAGHLAEAGVAVVSGAAAGVDGLAHTAALDAGGYTVAVLGGGVDKVQPPRHRRLLARIVAEGGAVVSEMPPGMAPKAGLYPRRNRIVSGLSDAVLVTAATGSSGSLITADHAWNQGRVVLAVPGDPRRALSAGTNRLLVRGASAVLEASHVLDLLFEIHGTARDGGIAADWAAAREVQGSGGAVATGVQLPLTAPARVLLERLEAVPHAADELALDTGFSGREVAQALAQLELAGLAERTGGGYVLAGSAGIRPGGHRSE